MEFWSVVLNWVSPSRDVKCRVKIDFIIIIFVIIIIIIISVIIIYYYILLYIIIYYYILLYTIIYYYILLYVIIHHYILLYIIICYYIFLLQYYYYICIKSPLNSHSTSIIAIVYACNMCWSIPSWFCNSRAFCTHFLMARTCQTLLFVVQNGHGRYGSKPWCNVVVFVFLNC